MSDRDGNVWIRAYPLSADDSVRRVVLDPGRGPVGRIRLPRDIEILDVGADRLLVRGTDSWGAETLEVWRVRKRWRRRA